MADIIGAQQELDALARDMQDTDRLVGPDPIESYRVHRWLGWWMARVDRARECLDAGVDPHADIEG